MMAMVSVAYADGLIACFDAKYFYEFWRPITAIRKGDTDGNEATVADPAWMHLAARHAEPPRLPECPLVHHAGWRRGTGGVPGTRRIDLTIPSLTGLGDRHYATVQEAHLGGRRGEDLGRHPFPHGC